MRGDFKKVWERVFYENKIMLKTIIIVAGSVAAITAIIGNYCTFKIADDTNKTVHNIYNKLKEEK